MTAEELRHGRVSETIRRHRLIVVLRRIEPVERLDQLVGDLLEAGARIFEVTFDAERAAEAVARLRDRYGERAVIGAGTLLSTEQVEAAIGAGAEFGVAPIFDTAVTGRAIGGGLPFVPGAFTPTEVAAAHAAGATFVKLFPASAVGPSFVRELRRPMPSTELIPTGGIDGENAAAFLEAGAAAVGIGGALVRADTAARRAIVRQVGR